MPIVTPSAKWFVYLNEFGHIQESILNDVHYSTKTRNYEETGFTIFFTNQSTYVFRVQCTMYNESVFVVHMNIRSENV